MSQTVVITAELIAHTVAAFVKTGLGDAAGVKAALELAHDRGTVAVGDRVISTCGNFIGIVQSISARELLVSWARRSSNYTVRVHDAEKIDPVIGQGGAATAPGPTDPANSDQPSLTNQVSRLR